MNHYEILGIQRPATRSEIRAAYLQLVQEAHPDRHVGDPDCAERDERFKRIHEAYEALHDVERRRHYDRHRWIPSAGSSGKTVVTPVRPGRHDLPSEWLQRANSRACKAKTSVLYRNLTLAVLIVLVGVGVQESRRHQLEQHEAATPRQVSTQGFSNGLPIHSLKPDRASSNSLLPSGENNNMKGNDAENSGSLSPPIAPSRGKGAFAAESEKEGPGVGTVAWIDPIQRRWGVIPELSDADAPFLGIPPSNTSFGFEPEPQIPSSDTILQALHFEDAVPPFQDAIHQLPEAEVPLDEYATANSQTFDFPTPLRKSRRRKGGRSSLKAAWQNNEHPPINVQQRYQRWLPPIDTKFRGTPILRYESMPPEFGHREMTAEVEANVPRGFPSASAVLSERRESSRYLGRQETPQEPVYDMSLPSFKSPPIRTGTPLRSSFDGFLPPGVGSRPWESVIPDR